LKSNDDGLYAETVRRVPRPWWVWKSEASNRRQDPRHQADRRPRPASRPLWVLPGPDELS